MIEFGSTLRAAREAKGLTPNDIAVKTHMMIQQVIDLENENFSRIAAPIYGRGFVRLYCEQVGLDPKPMIDEFMEIINGNREAVIRPRTVLPAAQPPPADSVMASEPATESPSTDVKPPEPVAMPEAVPAVDTSREEQPESDAIPVMAGLVQPEENIEKLADATTEVPKAGEDDFKLESVLVDPPPASSFDLDAKDTPKIEGDPAAPARPNVYQPPPRQRITPPKPIKSRELSIGKVPSAAWRIAALAVGALLLVWVLFASVRAIYRLATTAPEKPQGTVSTQYTDPSTLPGAPENVKKASRQPLSIPPLYID